jgi:hypothetical protein
MLAREHELSIKLSRSPFAAGAWPESHRVCHTLDNIAQTDISVGDKSGQAHFVGGRLLHTFGFGWVAHTHAASPLTIAGNITPRPYASQ